MNGLWQKRTYPITFELSTASKLHHIDLYGSFISTSWTKPIAQLTYAYQKNPGEYIYSQIVHLVPGNYDYKYKINNKDWCLNQNEKKDKDNNILSKDDFVQLILDRYDTQEMKNQDDQTRYHDVGTILYTDHTMYDVELVINDNDHHKAHRAILAAGSDFFKAMFQSGMTESTSNIVSLTLDDTQGFPSMLKFLYTGIVEVTNLSFAQLESLMKLADIYQIPTLLKALLNLTTRTIDVSNCLCLLFMQQFLGDRWTTTRKECIKIAANNFLYICHQTEFLNLPFDVLSDILDHGDISVPNQAMFYSALQRWSNNFLRNNQEDENESKISKYMIPDLYVDAVKNCNDTYKNPSAIVCFFADGTERYTTMTINAINSFLRSTPHVMIGLLVMNNDTKILVLSKIDRKYHYRILCKQTSKSPPIKDWNPTQYKLDIIKFSYDGFQEVYWMDSDTVVYKDMTSSLYTFRSSAQFFYFILDHVMYDSTFMQKWREQHQETFIPQACFMGFKSAIMPSFFLLWKQAWNTWTQPHPFSTYKDPNPTFPGSAFCIEQYALGNAVQSFIVKQSSATNQNLQSKYINTIGRKLIAITAMQPKQGEHDDKISRLRDIVGQQIRTSSLACCVPCVSMYLYSWCSSYNTSLVKRQMQHMSDLHPFAVIDEFFDCLLHFYNQNYDEGYQCYFGLYTF